MKRTRRHAMPLMLLAVLWLWLGTATTLAAREYKPGDAIALTSEQGLLALHITAGTDITSIKIDRVGALFGGPLITGLHQGSNFLLLDLPVGEYRLTRVNLRVGYLGVRDDPRFHFRIEPGVINYAGDPSVVRSLASDGFLIDVSNHTARMLVSLDRDYPGVRKRFALRYQGAFPDRFAQFAATELGEESAATALSLGASQAVTAPPAELATTLRPLVDELFARPQVSGMRMNAAGDLIAMIEYRRGKHHISLLDPQSGVTTDLYQGNVEVSKIAFVGNRILLFELDMPEGNNNFFARIDTHAGLAPTFSTLAIPGHGVFLVPTTADTDHVIYAHRNDDGDVHLFRIDLTVKNFNMAQFRSDLRLDKGVDKAFYGLTDGAGTLRLVLRRGEGDHVVMYRADGKSAWSEVLHYSADEQFEPISLSADGSSLIALSNRGRAQKDLVRLALPGGEVTETLFSLAGVDLDGVLTRAVDRHVLAVQVYRDGQLRTEYLDEPDGALQRALARVLPNKDVSIYDAASNGSRALVLASDEVDPGTYYFFDASSGKLQELLPIMAQMPHVHSARSQVIKVVAADGTAIEAYLTVPAQSPTPHPLIVMPHGGPIGMRDSAEFDPEVQLLVNRGYAVLRANYRGSGGFGAQFERAGFGAWGKSIEDDILAAVDAAVRAAPIDRGRIALRGASYGGYSTLMGLIRTPERFRCGVAMSAVSDLPLMFSSSDWSQSKNVRDRMIQMVGDPATALPAMEAISPDYLYRKLSRPLLLVHGEWDRRVTPEHALRLLMLLGHAGTPPQSLFLAREGHGIVGSDARYLSEASIDRFFAGCLAPAATLQPQTQAARGQPGP